MADPTDPSAPLSADSDGEAGDHVTVPHHDNVNGTEVPTPPTPADKDITCCETEVHTYHANCPSAIFARELKSYDDSEDPVIIVYNRSLLERKCMISSSEYDSTLDLNIVIRELFKMDKWWENVISYSIPLFTLATSLDFHPQKTETRSSVTGVVRKIIRVSIMAVGSKSITHSY